MKYINTLILLLLLALLSDCKEGPKKMGIEKIIAVEPHHATRITVVYKDKNGMYYRTSLHQSRIITDGFITINPHDYLIGYGDKKTYGPIKGQDKEYLKFKIDNFEL